MGVHLIKRTQRVLKVFVFFNERLLFSFHRNHLSNIKRLLSLFLKIFFNFYEFKNVIGPFNFFGRLCVKDSVVTGNILRSSFIMDHIKHILITRYENQYVLCWKQNHATFLVTKRLQLKFSTLSMTIGQIFATWKRWIASLMCTQLMSGHGSDLMLWTKVFSFP